jgi:uncharacterized surface protein with fasciclin (FAS1) repeats
MTKNKKYFFQYAAILLLAATLFVQCNKKDDVVLATDTIDTKLAADPELSIFKKAIVQARLESFTKGPGPFTILAPTNAALTAAGVTEASLATIDSITLTALLFNHFQNLKRTSFEFPVGPNAPMASMAGYNNFSSKNTATNTTYVNAAKVLETDINCSNGIIHKIDKYLALPVIPARTIIKNNPNYSLMDSAISKANLTTNFAPATGSATTIFLINNASMIAAGYPTLAAIGALTTAQVTTLSNILKYHIVQSRNFSIAFKAGTLKTLLGSNITVTTGSTVTVKGLSNTSASTFLTPDIIASNAVMHELSGILLP